MNLIKTYLQEDKNRLLIGLLVINTLLNGCNPFRNYSNEQFKPPHVGFNQYDSIATHEFAVQENQDLIGLVATIDAQKNDTLLDIARHFGLGYNDITIANPHFDPWLLESGYRVVLPLLFTLPDVQREGLVLNLANMRLFHFPAQQPDRVFTYPIGIGRDGWNTPTGTTTIIAKKKNPNWTVPVSIRKEHAEKGDPLPRVVPAGPDNPLGDYALRLGFPGYLIHGTNKPYGVGMQISHGCVRLYPENIATLFEQLPVGITVKIVEQPYMLGWDKEMLFLEAHRPQKSQVKTTRQAIFKKLDIIAEQNNVVIDWPKVDQILEQAIGIPIPILENSPDFASIVFSAPSITHPQIFNRQPKVKPITGADWSVTVASFNNPDAAQKLVAILNHQGPPIPSRRIQNAEFTHVVAGPFDSEKEAESVLNKIKKEFQLDGKTNPPQSTEQDQYSSWQEDWLLGKQ